MQFYLNPERESDNWALPDAEVFWADAGAFEHWDEEELPAGYYWWVCLPGCLPDSDPSGPFKSAEEAIKDAREMYGD